MHSHSHQHHKEKNIKIVVLLNVSFTILEIIGGLWTNSLAILADALHDFGDSVALITSLIAEKKAKKPADQKRTYGYQRLSLFSALFAGFVLLGGSLFILSEAIPRLVNPEPSHAKGMILLAIVGILINGLSLWKLKHGKSQNEKILSWHMLEDVLGWVAILIGGIIINFWNNQLIDPIMTIGFTLFVLWGAYRNLKETLNLFMQGVPAHINLEGVRKTLLKIDGVIDVHDMHIWSLEGESCIFTGHVKVRGELLKNPRCIKKQVKLELKKQHIDHSTIELEGDNCCSGIDCNK